MYSTNLTIMFTDMKGFTSRTSVRSREQIEKLINLQDKLILPIIERFAGKVVKTIGDSYLVTFDSPTSAVLCGKKIIEAAIPFFELRVAINTGEVNVKPDDIFGEPVNLASRLQMSTGAGEVYLTEAVYLAMNKNEIPLAEVGTRTFKGIPRPVRIYKVLRKKSLWEDLKNQLGIGYLRFVSPALLLLLGSVFIGIFLYFGQRALSKKTAESQVLSSEAIATPVPTPTASPTPSPSPSPTPVIQQIIIREVLVTPEPTPTLTPSPTPQFPQKSHKR